MSPLTELGLAAAALGGLWLLTGAAATLRFRARNPLRRLPDSGRTLYLTFDDGIDPVFTPRLLDLLAEQRIRASFFVCAETVARWPEIARRMAAEGHLVGLHSLSHRDQILQTPGALRRDFARSREIFRAAGLTPRWYRPPWGHVRPLGLRLCRDCGWRIVLWNVIVQDWQRSAAPERTRARLTARLRGNAVICLHDGRGRDGAPGRTIEMLRSLLPELAGKGYTFETVDRLD
jgi:peptidoglycan/xylan/chitin deacetylase (PgdA/CDA1 family)